MENIEIPEYFICPISLELMKDPVTAVSGITYDRDNIQRWLSIDPKCPVTMLPLPDSITPNNNLLRLIRTWCAANFIPVPDPPPTPCKLHVKTLVGDLRGPTKINAMQKLEALALKSHRSRVSIASEPDLTDSLVSFILSCHEKRSIKGLGEALRLLYIIRGTRPTRNGKIIESLLWVLDHHDPAVVKLKPYAADFLSAVIEVENPRVLDGLRPEFFRTVLSNLRPDNLISHEGVISLLNVLLDLCIRGKNRDIMVRMGAVSDLVLVEVRGDGDRETTELVFGILCHLCSCADGRAQLVGHHSGIAVVTRRILEVSPMADDSAVFVIWLVSRYMGTSSVLKEMERVGTVEKLRMVMKGDCKVLLKDKAKEILVAHSHVWKKAKFGCRKQ